MSKTSVRHNGRHNGKYDLSHDWKNVKAAIADVTRDASGKAGDLFTHSIKDIKHKSSDVKHQVKNYLYDKPFKSLGIAVLTGMFIGLWMRK